MNTDTGPDLTGSDGSQLLHKSETKAIIGCAFEVLNGIGPGLQEKIYENSLVVAFRQKGIPFDQQRRFPVVFLGETVGEFIPDLLVFGSVVTDAKVIEKITDHERGQMLNYLRITGLRVGLILNFKYPVLQWDRMVL
ncbi:MAG TPA: GxxExxY protein [Verrucomicrobiae bacterium]|nr:GxxExxY protein [Verrucomicrobiae bacterium]